MRPPINLGGVFNAPQTIGQGSSCRDVSVDFYHPGRVGEHVVTTKAAINDIRTPVRACALHGYLPPGTVAFVVPFDERGSLANFIANRSLYLPNLTNPIASRPTSGCFAAALFGQVVALTPGAVVDFGVDIRNGISVAVLSPGYAWDSAAGMPTYELGGFPLPMLRTVSGSASLVLPPSPVLFAPTFDATSDITTDPTLADTFNPFLHNACPFPAAARRIAVRLAPVSDSEVEVWWLAANGYAWVHHHDDDFDAAGLGLATSAGGPWSHIYDTGGMFSGVYLRCVTGELDEALVTVGV